MATAVAAIAVIVAVARGQKLVRKNGIAKNGERCWAGRAVPSISRFTRSIASALRTSLVALAKLYRGTHVDGRTIVMKQARVVEIELERPLAAELDGEVTRLSRLSIRVRPGALEVLAR